MIDNYRKTLELQHKMEEQLPIIVRPGKVIIQAIREQGIKLTSDQQLEIEPMPYLRDEGGIGYRIILPTQKNDVMVVSLTHLRVIHGKPLSNEIRAYQIERNRN